MSFEGCENTPTVNDGSQDDGAGVGKMTPVLCDSDTTIYDQPSIAQDIDPVEPNSNDFNASIFHRGDTLFYEKSEKYAAGNSTLFH